MEPEQQTFAVSAIASTNVLALGRLHASRRSCFTAFAAAALMHVYAALVLPAALDIEFEDDSVEANLCNDEIGIDPDLPTNYNVERIEEIVDPGPIILSETIWVPDPPGVARHDRGCRERREPDILYTK